MQLVRFAGGFSIHYQLIPFHLERVRTRRCQRTIPQTDRSLHMTDSLSDEDQSTLVRLEENMWREETRFDVVFMQKALAADFLD